MLLAKDNWTPLFNGKDLDGWQFFGRNEDFAGPSGFIVENGMIHTTDGKGMLCYTKRKLSHCVLRLVYKVSNAEANSGVFIRIPESKSEAYAIHNGIEVQIDDRDDDWHCTGVLYSMTKAKARASKPPGEWNTMDITLDGLRTLIDVNGTRITDYDGASPVPERTKPYEPERR